MGYNTNFHGNISTEPTLTEEDADWLEEYCDARHNPSTEPGYNCDWTPCDDLDDGVKWNGSEKSYFMPEWLAHLIETFFEPNGYVLNGSMQAQGEEPDDMWLLEVDDNKVTTVVLVAQPSDDITEYN